MNKPSSFSWAACAGGLAVVLGACSGGAADLGGHVDGGTPDGSSASGGGGPGGCAQAFCLDGGPDTGGDEMIDAGGCTLNVYKTLIPPGGAITPRPSGNVLRLTLAYQGPRLAITSVQGTTMVLGTSTGPYTAGVNAGYWVEVRDASESTLYQHWILDPTTMEAAGPDGGFMQIAIPYCQEKTVMADVPNDPNVQTIVFFGSDYGTSSAAHELARFHVP
jgi:hypothetical protein